MTQKLSKLTNQRVYQKLVYQNRSIKESLTGSLSVPSPVSPPSFFFFARSNFSLAPLSESLEQASVTLVYANL